MGILDNPAVKMMIMEMVKTAAPDLVSTMEGIAGTIAMFKEQLDRIEQRQIRLENALTNIGVLHDAAGSGRTETAERNSVVAIVGGQDHDAGTAHGKPGGR